jgi:hypothetical protein
MVEIGAKISSGLRKLAEDGGREHVPAPALVLFFYTAGGLFIKDTSYAEAMAKASAGWGGAVGEGRGEDGEETATWAPLVVGLRSWNRSYCDAEGTPDTHDARHSTTALVFADGILESNLDDAGDSSGEAGSAGAHCWRGRGGGWYGVGVESLDDELDNVSHPQYKRGATQTKAAAALNAAVVNFPEGKKPLALWVAARVGLEEAMLEGVQQALDRRGWHNIAIAGGSPPSPGLVLSDGVSVGRAVVVIAFHPGGDSTGARYRVEQIFDSGMNRTKEPSVLVHGVEMFAEYSQSVASEASEASKASEAHQQSVPYGRPARGRQIERLMPCASGYAAAASRCSDGQSVGALAHFLEMARACIDEMKRPDAKIALGRSGGVARESNVERQGTSYQVSFTARTPNLPLSTNYFADSPSPSRTNAMAAPHTCYCNCCSSYFLFRL